MTKIHEIKKIRRNSLDHDLKLVDVYLNHYRWISFDTEFQPFILATPRESPEDVMYEQFQINVNRHHLFQIGFTLFDCNGNIGGAWEIDFNDAHYLAPRLMEKKGIDPDKNSYEGVDRFEFGRKFRDLLRRHEGKITWVTFHGIYDFGYLLKIVTGNKRMPGTIDGFVELIGQVFNVHVIDLKVVAKHVDGLWDGEIGLNEMSNLLKVERVGVAHRAGSDSLLTAKDFIKMVRKYGLHDRMERFEGFLYGISTKITREMMDNRPMVPQMRQHRQYIRPCATIATSNFVTLPQIIH